VAKAKMLPFIAFAVHAALSSPLVLEEPLDDVISLSGIELCTTHQFIVSILCVCVCFAISTTPLISSLSLSLLPLSGFVYFFMK
jgi:hypothetical protein